MTPSRKRTASETGSANRNKRDVLRVGSRVPQHAYRDDGALLLRSGATIETASAVRRLACRDVRFGRGRLNSSTSHPGSDAASHGPELDRILDSRAFQEQLERAAAVKQEAVEDVARVFERIDSGGIVDVGQAQRAVTGLLGEMLDDPYALVSLAQIKDVDHYTFTHSVNVCILATYLALNSDHCNSLEEIGVGALLHDVGKTAVPPSVLNKSGPLDNEEWRIIKEHPVCGARRLADAGEQRDIVIACTLGHHEKIAGGGYPFGRTGNAISPFAMITSIADVYDALTTDRPYRPALAPDAALQLMSQRMAEDLDPGLLERFIAIVAFLAKVRNPGAHLTGNASPTETLPETRATAVRKNIDRYV